MKLKDLYELKFNEKHTIGELLQLYNYEQETNKKLEELEMKFNLVEMYRRSTTPVASKNYIINKKRRCTKNIQKDVREKIDNLNKTYKQNKYYFQIEHEIVDNTDNKHVYNKYDSSVVEFRHLNINDVINETPIPILHLPSIIKLKLYEDIAKFIKSEKSKLTQTDKNNKYQSFHNNFIEALISFINKRLVDTYGNIFISRLNSIITQYCDDFLCLKWVCLNEVFEHFPLDVKEEIIDVLIETQLSTETIWPLYVDSFQHHSSTLLLRNQKPLFQEV